MTLPTSPRNLEMLALTRILAGDTSKALEAVRQAVELGWANYYGVVNDPAWAATLEKPGFQALLAEAKANNDRQREIVEAVDAEHDFRHEFAQLQGQQSRAIP